MKQFTIFLAALIIFSCTSQKKLAQAGRPTTAEVVATGMVSQKATQN